MEPEVHFESKARAPVVLVIPFRNVSQYIERCLQSILDQNLKIWHCVFVDDASTDDTVEKITKFVNTNNIARKVTLIKNAERKYALWNTYFAIKNFIDDRNAIVGIIDGDDWLYTIEALKVIWKEYRGPYDMIWTQHVRYPGNLPGYSFDASPSVPRNQRRGISHFKTFRKHLFDAIPEEEFLDVHGNFFKYTYDKAITYPMIELASHPKFLDRVLYVYNCENSNNVEKGHQPEQYAISLFLENKRPLNLSGSSRNHDQQ